MSVTQPAELRDTRYPRMASGEKSTDRLGEKYIPAGQNIVLSHTEVPMGLEGQGIGGQLIKQVLEIIKNNGQKIIIVCPFVATYIKKHPEYLDLVFGYQAK